MNTNLSRLSDEDVLRVFKESGKPGCVRELFIRYLMLIYGVCLNYLKDADDAENAVKQIFNNILLKSTDFEATPFRQWIYYYTKSYCLQIQGKENYSITLDSDDRNMEFDRIIALFESDDVNQIALLTNCLKELSPQQRMSINYFFKEKLSFREIADKGGFTLKHVKGYIQSAKQDLINFLEKKTANEFTELHTRETLRRRSASVRKGSDA